MIDEGAIRQLFDAGDLRGATTKTLELYGPEILGLLCSIHRDHDEAGDAFSAFAERLWRSLERFEYKCSMRTWAYVVARRASHDVRRAAQRRERRAVPLSEAGGLEELVAKVRTATMTIMRTETKTELAKLRDELPEEDRLLLVLRVDRRLGWNELALVFLEEKEGAADDAQRRESARLRKRFQLVKERLQALAKERGLLDA